MQKEFNNIVQVRYEGPALSFDIDDIFEDFPYVNLRYFTMEISRDVGDNVYVIEKLVLDDIDWTRETRQFAGVTVLVLVIVLSNLLTIANPAVGAAFGSAAARYIPRLVPYLP